MMVQVGSGINGEKFVKRVVPTAVAAKASFLLMQLKVVDS